MPWLRGRSVPPEDQRRSRLLRVLQSAASQTRYARQYSREVRDFEELPRVELLEFLCHTDRFAVPNLKPAKEKLQYPLGAPPRTAVVGRVVEESRKVRCFSALHSEGLREFAPHCVAAPLDALRMGSNLGPLRNAVIVFSGILEGPLTPADGDRLWREFQVPVFEQFLGLDGELLAWECEIHHGLHVRAEAAHFECLEQDQLLVSFLANPRLPVLRLETGLAGRLVEESCPCGDPAPRLVDMRRRSARRATSAGAMAVAAVS